MSFEYKQLKINKISIVGAGQIGPDIALHFAKTLSAAGVEIVIIDIADEALANARKKIEKKIARGEETGAFKSQKANRMRQAFSYTKDYQQLSGSQIVLEAATENEEIKDAIFKKIESICDENCLFFSNSSHMQPEVIFKSMQHKNRCLVTHYFFPAERNPVLELIPGKETDPGIIDMLSGFYESIGKIPITVKSSYGYAIDPIFEGLCQTAILCAEKGYGTVKEIDKIAHKVLGLGVGPFTALNLTGGNPITDHGLEEMHEKLNPWFFSPKSLHDAVINQTPWPTAKRGEEVPVARETADRLSKQFLGAYFALASFIMDTGIVALNDLNMATEIALVVKAPFSLMNKTGIKKSWELVQAFCKEHNQFPLPSSLPKAVENGGWKLSDIRSKIEDHVAILTIMRPKYLNALNEKVITDLHEALLNAEKNTSVKGIVITGFGNKAFVSGADIRMLAGLKTKEDAYNNSMTFHKVLNYIESMKKPVVCAYNGFAFGGGNELAMACHQRISRKGMKVLACQPEVKLGIIPGAGATQRLPRLIGFEKATEMLRTGKSISSQEALEYGLIFKETADDLLSEAKSIAMLMAEGKLEAKLATHYLNQVPDRLPDTDIGELSKKIDQILCRAILDGATMRLDKGLELEARLFGKCLNTEDMKIGLKTFMEEGPRAQAKFIHR